MTTASPSSASDSLLLLGIDTCGPSGSVALGRIAGAEIVLLGETALEGRTYSATLIAAVESLLQSHAVALREIGCIVVVNGPGSFTGVRVGLSAAKGLAEGAGLRILAVSRLEVLAQKSDLPVAALDAHRHELFLRVEGRELLAGPAELAAILPAPACIAACDDAAAQVLSEAWPATQILRVPAPTAADALRVALPRIRAREFADVVLLDGHYLRRSDAEIFGEKQPSPARQ